MDGLLAASAAERRFALVLFEAFGAVSLLLAAVGVYGVLAGTVAERAREIGIRLTLGASRARVLGTIVRQGLSLAAFGAVIGAPGAVLAGHALASLLFGVPPLDPLTFTGVAALLGGVSLVACSIPAWRAARVDPSVTLRAE